MRGQLFFTPVGAIRIMDLTYVDNVAHAAHGLLLHDVSSIQVRYLILPMASLGP